METTLFSPSQRDPDLWKQAKARVDFQGHLRSYLIVNAGLWLIWAVSAYAVFRSSDAGEVLFPWPLFPLFGWGIGLASHYLSTYRFSGRKDRIEREYQKLANQP